MLYWIRPPSLEMNRAHMSGKVNRSLINGQNDVLGSAGQHLAGRVCRAVAIEYAEPFRGLAPGSAIGRRRRWLGAGDAARPADK